MGGELHLRNCKIGQGLQTHHVRHSNQMHHVEYMLSDMVCHLIRNPGGQRFCSIERTRRHALLSDAHVEDTLYLNEGAAKYWAMMWSGEQHMHVPMEHVS